MNKNTATLDVTATIAELVKIRADKSVLAKREGAIRKDVLAYADNSAGFIANPDSGELLAEIVASERRSVSDWDKFAEMYPEAYEALVKFTPVLTLNTLEL